MSSDYYKYLRMIATRDILKRNIDKVTKSINQFESDNACYSWTTHIVCTEYDDGVHRCYMDYEHSTCACVCGSRVTVKRLTIKEEDHNPHE